MILDLFAGPGGWSEGLRSLGLSDVGIEWDAAACATRAAAGHLTIRADVSTYPTAPFVGGKVTGLIASPPCTDFSIAGLQAGRSGTTGRLVEEVPRWVQALRPVWVACEQVPQVLPIWQEFAEEFRREGYSVWTGLLSAERYGVPQTRERAFLLARRDGRAAAPPAPTHRAYRGRECGLTGDLFGDGLLPWVSMAEALSWGLMDRPAPTVSSGGTDTGGAEVFANAAMRRRITMCSAGRTAPQSAGQVPRTPDEPAATLTGKGTAAWVMGDVKRPNAAMRRVDEPAPASMDNGNIRWVQRRNSGPGAERTPRSTDDPSYTIRAQGSGSHPSGVEWVHERPATTVVGSFRPDVIAAPGWRKAGDGPRQNAAGSVRVTVQEAAVLQGFRPNYPWQGSKTKQYQQVGNAVCPPLAAAIVRELTS